MSKFIVFSIFIHIIFGALIISVSDQDIWSSLIKGEKLKNKETQASQEITNEELKKDIKQQNKPLAQKALTQKGSKEKNQASSLVQKQSTTKESSQPRHKETDVALKNTPSDKDFSQKNTPVIIKEDTTTSTVAQKQNPTKESLKKDNMVSVNKKPQTDLEKNPSQKNIPVVMEKDKEKNHMSENQNEDSPLEQQVSKHSLEQIIDEHPNLTAEHLAQDLKALENIDDSIPDSIQEDSPDSSENNLSANMEDIPLPPSDEDIPLIPTEEELAQNLNKQTVPLVNQPSRPQNQPNELRDKNVKQYTHLLQASGNPPISYPESARQRQLEGAVEVLYFVNDSGFVDQMKVLKSSGHPSLDDEALRTLSKHQYLPGQEGWYRHKVEFKLQKSQKISHLGFIKHSII